MKTVFRGKCLEKLCKKNVRKSCSGSGGKHLRKRLWPLQNFPEQNFSWVLWTSASVVSDYLLGPNVEFHQGVLLYYFRDISSRDYYFRSMMRESESLDCRFISCIRHLKSEAHGTVCDNLCVIISSWRKGTRFYLKKISNRVINEAFEPNGLTNIWHNLLYIN